MSESKSSTGKRALTSFEALAVSVVVVIVLLVGLSALPRVLEARKVQACQANLKRIGEALRMFAAESVMGPFPRVKWRDCNGEVQPWSGAMDLEGVVPEYLESADVFVCPDYPAGKTALEIWDEGQTTNPRWKAVDGFSHNGALEPCEVLGKPYYYYGWAFSERTFEDVTKYVPRDPEDRFPRNTMDRGIPMITPFDPTTYYDRFQIAAVTYAEAAQNGTLSEQDDTWTLTYPSGKPLELPIGTTIRRLEPGAERWYFRDINNPVEHRTVTPTMVVMHEELFDKQGDFYHSANTVNVLYLDGHVANKPWQPNSQWSAKFPLNEAGYILHEAVEGTLELPSPDAR